MDIDFLHLSETHSTNDWLKEHPGGDLLVWADFQTAGRGSGTNSWESEAGKNLLFSMRIHPDGLTASCQFNIAMAMSLAIVRALQPIVAEGLSIKWPNDIYWHDRKLGGMLIENRLTGSTVSESVIGVGLNVNQERFLSDAPNPVSLRQITGLRHDREAVLRSVTEIFTLDADIFDYRHLLYRRDGFFPYRDADGTFEAEMETVEDDGHLLLRDRSGRLRRYAFKEVAYII